jgi:hypothetical protein
MISFFSRVKKPCFCVVFSGGLSAMVDYERRQAECELLGGDKFGTMLTPTHSGRVVIALFC